MYDSYFHSNERIGLNEYIKLSNTSNTTRIVANYDLLEYLDCNGLDFAINNLFAYYSSCDYNKKLLDALDKIIFNHISCVKVYNEFKFLIDVQLIYDIPKGLYNLIMEQSDAITPELKEKKLEEYFKNSFKKTENKLGF